MFDGALFGEEIVKEVRGYVEKATAPLVKEIEDLRAKLAAIEARPLAEVVKGEDGKDGQDGLSATDEQIAEQVAKYLEANPPANGEDGKDGVDGRDGVDGQDGQKGLDGKDGIGLAGAIIDRAGELVVTLTDGTTRELGPVVGTDGVKGDRGDDGLGFDDMDITRPDERTLVVTFTKGDIKRSFEVSLEHPIYRGVFTEGQTYDTGDTVTWGGSSWHCNERTADKPGEGSKAWSLMTKRGRDGKDAK